MLVMKHTYQEMVDFIIKIGLYPQFKGFSTATPYIKSKRRKAYLFLVQKNKWNLFSKLPCTFDKAQELVKVSFYEVS